VIKPTDHRCTECRTFLKVDLLRDQVVLDEKGLRTDDVLAVEELVCSGCSDARVKRAKAKESKARGRDAKKYLTKAGIAKRKKAAEKLLGLLDPCQRQLGHHKCKVLKKDHATYSGSGKMPACPRWTNATAAEQREAALALVKKSRAEEKAQRDLERAEKLGRKQIKQHRAKVAESKAKRDARKRAVLLAERLVIRQAKLEKLNKINEKVRAKREKVRAARRARKEAGLAKAKAQRNKERQMKAAEKSKASKKTTTNKEKSVKGKKGKATKKKINRKAMKVGTKLSHAVRGGKTVNCTVVKDGYKFGSKVYESASGAARAAAESLGLNPNQNGFLFWTNGSK
jgi:hypothetical protein